ncbi:DsbA family oxidoreductase [Nocardioides mesophilus]|uniref:DsbA family protein n=1 Tax=Nocardioides mesophilus TaxID=433659 RepID=A0A7G9RAQ7_9ACTN|nr:DsbA family protein [Nocardioides mesophilus]QNN52682.1 DsbA family protein [Nocardioides mesophilus]
MSTDRIVVYGDFNCPWSYLASRRAAQLASDGVEVDWRAVEHEPWRPQPFSDTSTRFHRLRDEMPHVLEALLPGEELPYALAGFVPFTHAAVSGYAEAYGAGVGDRVRHLLFEALWLHGIDLGDAQVVRTLLTDAIRSGRSDSEPLHDWGYAVDVFGGPITTTAWRLREQWVSEWQAGGQDMVPVLVRDGEAPLVGLDAVRWLGAELHRRGIDPHRVPVPEPLPMPQQREEPSLSWVAENGNHWQRDHQRLHRAFPVPSLVGHQS